MLYYKTYLHKSTKNSWVTFVHGAGGSSAIWFSQIRAFQKEFNVLTIDLRGHGKSKSTHPKDSYRFTNIADEVVEVIDFLKIEMSHFVGVSLGTIVIMDIGHRYPSKVHSLVLGGAVMYLNMRAQILMHLGVVFKKIIPYLWLYRLFAYVIMPKRTTVHQGHFLSMRQKK